MPSKYQISTNTTPLGPLAFIPVSYCSGGGAGFKVQPSHCFFFFKRRAKRFIYRESAAVNDRKSSTIYGQVQGAGELRAKPEVLARPVKDYKALVVAHDLFMAG